VSHMTDEEFYELAIHTDKSEVSALRDHTAGQVMLKMAALAPYGSEGTQVTIRFDSRLGLQLVTPLGVYTMILDSTGERLEVMQVV
jgi:hypothetical protein